MSLFKVVCVRMPKKSHEIRVFAGCVFEASQQQSDIKPRVHKLATIDRRLLAWSALLRSWNDSLGQGQRMKWGSGGANGVCSLSLLFEWAEVEKEGGEKSLFLQPVIDISAERNDRKIERDTSPSWLQFPRIIEEIAHEILALTFANHWCANLRWSSKEAGEYMYKACAVEIVRTLCWECWSVEAMMNNRIRSND